MFSLLLGVFMPALTSGLALVASSRLIPKPEEVIRALSPFGDEEVPIFLNESDAAKCFMYLAAGRGPEWGPEAEEIRKRSEARKKKLGL